MDARLAAFPAEAGALFRFLVDRFGFEGPDAAEEGYLGYTLPPWQVWVVMDEHNQTVDTYLWYRENGAETHAPLHAVLTAMGLPAQWAANSAQTRAGMIKSLARQANALSTVLPRITGPDGADLLSGTSR